MFIYKRDAEFNGSFIGNGADPQEDGSGDGNVLGGASDYILVAMIVAMLLCMTVCCLCLFCRSTSQFTICGWNFEINNERNHDRIEDLSELHEVLPLTPTSTNTYNLIDIESKLKSDPPPPNYNEVSSKSVFDRLRWKNRRRGASIDDKSIAELNASKLPNSQRNRHFDRRSFTCFFQRSISYQPPQVSTFKTARTLRRCSDIKEEGLATLPQSQGKPSKSVLPKSASDFVFTRSVSVLDEPKFASSQIFFKAGNSSQFRRSSNQSSKESGLSKELSSGCSDDEVFM